MHRPIKVIHFVGYFPPQRLGGVGEFVAGLHGALREAGHFSTVVTTGHGSRPDVQRIARRPLGWFFKSLLWAREASRYDVVHCQSGEALALLLVLALRRRRPRILTTFHVHYAGMAAAFEPYTLGGRSFSRGLGPWIYRHVVSSLHRFADAVALRLSDAVNTISVHSAREVFGESRADGARIVYYGLAELPETAEQAEDVEPVEILYAGTCGHRKRIASLPYVLERVRHQIPGARLRILGFVPERAPEVVGILEAKQLWPHVEFVGIKTSAELPPFYARAGVLVVPSAYEGLPLVILEAMRSGLPVVATRVGGHPEVIVDGENGFLVDPDAPEQMADRCVRILRDGALRARMSAASRRTIRRRFTLERELREYVEIYESLIADRRP